MWNLVSFMENGVPGRVEGAEEKVVPFMGNNVLGRGWEGIPGRAAE